RLSLVHVLESGPHASKSPPRGGIRRWVHVVVMGRGAARGEKAGQPRGLRAQTKACYRWRVFGQGASPAMPRYHFHITNGRESLDNPKGMDLPGNPPPPHEAVGPAPQPTHRPNKP